MRIAFRVDSSLSIGSGHVIRCLTLAAALRDTGWDCHFICRELPGSIWAEVQRRGFPLTLLPAPVAHEDDRGTPHSRWLEVSRARDADECRLILDRLRPNWLIVDHYALDAAWEAAARPEGAAVLAIDDLADRPHCCELLLDQTVGRQAEAYDHLLPEHSECLVGSEFAVLRREFALTRAASLGARRNAPLKGILVNMGGVDPENVTGVVLTALSRAELPKGCRVTVVMGPTAPWLGAVTQQAAAMPFPTKVLWNVDEMAAVVAEADLAIGAAGTAAWERCCLGVPTLTAVLADNQAEICRRLEELGAAFCLGPVIDDDFAARLPAELARLLNPIARATMSAAAAKIIDGLGTDRVIAQIVARTYSVREARFADAPRVYGWRYTDSRTLYHNAEMPTMAEHLQWFRNALNDPSRHLLICQWNGRDIGHVRLDRSVEEPSIATISICIAPQERGRGNAAPVLRSAVAEGRQKGITSFRARVHVDNGASRRLFTGLGFHQIAQCGDFMTYAADATDLLCHAASEVGQRPATRVGRKEK